MIAAMTPPWNDIDTVLLDMDGTLLDLHFDDHFWQHHLPRRYAERFGIPLERARRHLQARFDRERGTLNWYCLDYWSRELGLAVERLKHEVAHLIRIHPGVIPFLRAAGAAGKRRVLVTNAHWAALDLKLAHTALQHHLDHIVVSHDLGLPKEDPRLWRRLRSVVPYDPGRTLLVDDSEAVLDSAHRHGIRHLLTLRRPSSQGPRREGLRYPAIDGFEQLLPIVPSTTNEAGQAADDEDGQHR